MGGLSEAAPSAAAFADRYQPYWAVRTHLLADASEMPDAAACFERAISLTRDAAVRNFCLVRK